MARMELTTSDVTLVADSPAILQALVELRC
jgi:hypothetical protein